MFNLALDSHSHYVCADACTGIVRFSQAVSGTSIEVSKKIAETEAEIEKYTSRYDALPLNMHMQIF